MATRALVGYFDNQNKKFIATYNHFDGYPSSLGVGLENHYDTPQKAMEIASKGYISYLDPETGEIEAKNEDKPKVININTDWETAIVSIAETIESFGVNYAYIYSPDNEEWVDIKYSNMTSTLEDLFQAFAAYADQFDEDEYVNQFSNTNQINESQDNFDLRKYLAEGKLLKEVINNKYVVKVKDEDGDYYKIDTRKAFEYLKQFNTEEVDARQFIMDDEGWGEFENIQYLVDIEQMSDKELENAMRQEMSFYYYSDGDSI